MGLSTPSPAFLLGRILMPTHWSWAQGPTFPAVTTSPYEIGTRRWWQPLIFFLCPSGLGTIALWVSQGRNDSGQYSWLVAPGVELLPYKWGLGGERRPQSFWPYLPGIELLQHEIRNTSTWALLGWNHSPQLETVQRGISCLGGCTCLSEIFHNTELRGVTSLLLFLQRFSKFTWMNVSPFAICL